MFWKNLISLFSRRKAINWKNDDADKLIVYLEYLHSGGYTSTNRTLKTSFEKLLKDFKEGVEKTDYVYIESKYNGISYPFFDLDTEEIKETFLQMHEEERFVLFQSSPDHYWAILDTQQNLVETFNDTRWITCNDPRYVKISKELSNLRIRGLYESHVRKPQIILQNHEKDFSANFSNYIQSMVSFSNYIQSMVSFYNNEALELSALKYKTPELILLFDRKKKLAQLKEAC